MHPLVVSTVVGECRLRLRIAHLKRDIPLAEPFFAPTLVVHASELAPPPQSPSLPTIWLDGHSVQR